MDGPFRVAEVELADAAHPGRGRDGPFLQGVLRSLGSRPLASGGRLSLLLRGRESLSPVIKAMKRRMQEPRGLLLPPHYRGLGWLLSAAKATSSSTFPWWLMGSTLTRPCSKVRSHWPFLNVLESMGDPRFLALW